VGGRLWADTAPGGRAGEAGVKVPLTAVPRPEGSLPARDARAIVAEGARSPSPEPLPPPGTEVVVVWLGQRAAVIRLPEEGRTPRRWVVPIADLLVDPDAWRWAAGDLDAQMAAEARRRGRESRARALMGKGRR